jgi:phospholipid/cholesterol/gamma-HCH transport system permease protein
MVPPARAAGGHNFGGRAPKPARIIRALSREAMDQEPSFRLERTLEGTVCVRFEGTWLLASGIPPRDTLERELGAAPARRLTFDGAGLRSWDSALVAFVLSAWDLATRHGLQADLGDLPEGAQRLVRLAQAVPERERVARDDEDSWILAQIGRSTLAVWDAALGLLGFLGECTGALFSVLRGRTRFGWAAFALLLEDAGADSLPIVALINFLLGAVLAFVGAVQLQAVGASIYVADLVAIGVTREIGALMTGLVLAGRTGASFAAHLGTMTVNEETDALRTMGYSPLEYLVVPRLVALILMTPLLVACADAVGILGGLVVGVTTLGLGPFQYLNQTTEAMALNHFAIGLLKGCAFGFAVALCGCYFGLRCQRSASGVGRAATEAVVAGTILVVFFDAVLTVLFHSVGL